MTSWTKEQIQAIETRGKNIIVSAGAGSGKTEVLSERVINNLMKGYMHINEMLILTFTKNAAAEMKERIKKKILTHEEIKKEALIIDSADITNFDAFTLALVKKYHYLLNIDSNIGVIDSSIIKLKKIEYLNQIFNEEYENNKKFEELILNFCSKNDNQVKTIILDLYNKIDLLSNSEEYLKSYINNYYNEENINKMFKDYEANLINKTQIIKELLINLEPECGSEFYEKYYNAHTPLINAKTYEEIKSALEIDKFTLRGATELGKAYKKEITERTKELKKSLIYSKEYLLQSVINTKEYVEVIINILIKLIDKINTFKEQYNAYEFNDISKFAIKLLKENENLRLELKNHYKEIMIDEYQDTSDIEEEFINLIENNNVYMVGDIKQSIYRFRNANPNIFKDKYDLYKNTDKGIKLDLNKNFRSRKEVLYSINDIFNHIMDNKIGNANYQEEHNLIPGNITFDNEGKVDNDNNLEILNYEPNNINTKEEIEAFIIANDIKNKINKQYKVFDKEIRPCKYSDFCILLDRGTTFNLYKKIFDYLNIPLHIYQDEDILFETETYLINNIIALIINIKKGIYNEDTNLYYTSIARSYLFEIKDEEIYNTIKNKKIKDTQIYRILENISKQIDYMTNEEILQKIIEDFNFYENLIKVGNIRQKTIILENLLKKFKDLNKVGINIYEINNYINSLIDNKEKIKIPGLHVNIDSVTLTNIHKSKGLEYKICYFAGYNKPFSKEDIKSKVRFDNKYGIIFPDYKNGYIETFISELNKINYKIDDISEKIRLLYVALTRCKEKMIIVVPLKEKDYYLLNGDMVEYTVRSNYKSFEEIIESTYPYIEKYIEKIEVPQIDVKYKIPKNTKIEITNNNEIIKVEEKIFQETTVTEEHYSKNNLKLLTKEEKNNMELGTHIHYILEITDFKNPNYSSLNEYETTIINGLLTSEIMKNIQNANILKEYEFIYEINNTKKTGIIDLMLEYDNHIDIIDYKLKNVTDDAYKKQLNGYKEYIEKLTNKPVNTYLYSLLDRNLTKI